MGKDARDLERTADAVMQAMRDMQAFGRGRARKQAEVAALAGTTSRTLQMATLVLIERGVPVVTTCETPSGMFVAETLSEIADYGDQLYARIRGNALRLKGVRRIARRWDEAGPVESTGQRRLFA